MIVVVRAMDEGPHAAALLAYQVRHASCWACTRSPCQALTRNARSRLMILFLLLMLFLIIFGLRFPQGILPRLLFGALKLLGKFSSCKLMDCSGGGEWCPCVSVSGSPHVGASLVVPSHTQVAML